MKFRARARTVKAKLEVMEAYGSLCVCCGEKEMAFLTIDHINGGGKEHRKLVGFGTRFYEWLKKNNYPKDKFQLLCMNCNFAKGKSGGFCPHQLYYRASE